MHVPVLLHEAVEGLNLKEDAIFVDGTYGAGGHTREVLRRFPRVQAISIDRDSRTGADITGNFRNLDKLIGHVRPDAILLDLGFSGDQLESGRGFSFQVDEPLDMRMSGEGITAAEILNNWDEETLELILRGFGEEENSRRIAKEIVARRELKPFTTTEDLLEVLGERRGKRHPATKTFQALRIAVNEELPALEEGLEKAFKALTPQGRLAVISFHSLEDRIVKNFFRDKAKAGEGKLITKKPTVPSGEEVKKNPRSRSAKLRIIEKINA